MVVRAGWRVGVTGLALLLAWGGLHLDHGALGAGPRSQDPIWEITSPRANAQLRGTVEVTGSAYLAGDFSFYKLEYAPASLPGGWIFLLEGRQEVLDGLLGAWDTTTVADGTYLLKLTVVHLNSQFQETAPRQVVVANAQPTETATPTATPEASPEPTSTIIIEQPTVTRFVITPLATRIATPPSRDGGLGTATLPDLSSLFRSFLGGTLVGGAVLAVVGAVFLLRRAVSE